MKLLLLGMKHRALIFKKKPKSGLWHKLIVVIILLVLLVVGAILTSIFIFGHLGGRAGNRLVEVKIRGEQMVDSLAPSQYTISLTNREISDLKSAELKVDFPRGFIIENISQPCEEKLISGCTWLLGKIGRGEKKDLTLQGYFLESSKTEGDLKDFKGSVNFQLEDFSSVFQKDFDYAIFVRPILSAEITGPSELIPGQNYNWQVKITNTSDKKIDQPLETVLSDLPSGLNISSGENQNESVQGIIYNSDQRTWSINGLEPQEGKTINVSGLLQSGAVLASPAEFTIKVGFLVNNNFFVQQEVEQQISSRDIGLSLSCSTANGQTVFAPGDELPISLVYNNSSLELKRINLILTISDGSLLDKMNLALSTWQWLSNNGNFLSSNKWDVASLKDGSQTFSWNSSQIESLNDLMAGDQGKINLSLKLNSLPYGTASEQLKITLAASGQLSDGGGDFHLGGPVITININNNP